MTTTISALKGFNYFSLPRELRDQIMQYVLHPGEVCIPTDNSSVRDRPRYGVQVLATCHQAYAEGHRVWYGRNKFRLRSCSANGMSRILGAYQAKHLGMMPELVVDCTLHDLPLLYQNNLLSWSISLAAGGITRLFAVDVFWDKLNEALEKEWIAKAEWLRKEVPNGHRMHISLDGSTFDKLWFDLGDTKMQFSFGFLCGVKEVRMGTTITTEPEEPLGFQNFHDLLPGQFSGLVLTQKYGECPRNQTLRNSIRIRGVYYEETVSEEILRHLLIDEQTPP